MIFDTSGQHFIAMGNIHSTLSIRLVSQQNDGEVLLCPSKTFFLAKFKGLPGVKKTTSLLWWSVKKIQVRQKFMSLTTEFSWVKLRDSNECQTLTYFLKL